MGKRIEVAIYDLLREEEISRRGIQPLVTKLLWLFEDKAEDKEKEAFKRGYIAVGLDSLKTNGVPNTAENSWAAAKKVDTMNTALNDSKRFRVNEEEIYKNDMCTCNHERKDHRKAVMINSTQLGCGLCECRWFKISAGQSNNSL